MRLWLAISFILVFLAGAAVGILATQLSPKTVAAPAGSLEGIIADMPTQLVTSEEVWGELGLDPDQRKALDTFIADHYGRVRRVRRDFQEVGTELENGILAVLRPEQQERWREIQAAYSDRQIQRSVSHPLVDLSLELELAPEQLPWVYQILYDAEVERREAAEAARDSGRRGPPWDKWVEIADRTDARLREILTFEQNTVYAERREREKRWWMQGRGPGKESRRERDTAEKAGGPPPESGECPPAPAPDA